MGNTGSFHKLQVRNHQNKSKQVVWLPYGQFSIGWHDMLKSFQEKGMLGLRETSQTEGYDLQCTQHKIQTHYHLPCPTAMKTICTLNRLGIDWCEASQGVPGCGSWSCSSTARSWRGGWVWWAQSPDSGAPDPWTSSAHGHSAAHPASYSWRTDSWGERTGVTRGNTPLSALRNNTLKGFHDGIHWYRSRYQ